MRSNGPDLMELAFWGRARQGPRETQPIAPLRWPHVAILCKFGSSELRSKGWIKWMAQDHGAYVFGSSLETRGTERNSWGHGQGRKNRSGWVSRTHAQIGPNGKHGYHTADPRAEEGEDRDGVPGLHPRSGISEDPGL